MAIQQKLTDEQQVAYEHFKHALYSLLAVWDSLYDLNQELGLDVNDDDLVSIAEAEDDSVEGFLQFLENGKLRNVSNEDSLIQDSADDGPEVRILRS
jgi:hypothetical protein